MFSKLHFPHDFDAYTKPKLVFLRVKYGWEGYGLYWFIIESLRGYKNYRINLLDIPALAHNCQSVKLTDVLFYCIEIGLLSKNEEYFWSPTLCERLANVDKLSAKQRANAIKRWEKYGKVVKRNLAVKTARKIAKENSKPKPYVLYKDDLSQIVYAYKVTQGYDIDDRDWDKGNFARVKKTAILLLALFKSKEIAIECIYQLGAEFKEKQLSWTIEGAIMKNASAWYQRHKIELHHKANMERIKKEQEQKRAELEKEVETNRISKEEFAEHRKKAGING